MPSQHSSRTQASVLTSVAPFLQCRQGIIPAPTPVSTPAGTSPRSARHSQSAAPPSSQAVGRRINVRPRCEGGLGKEEGRFGDKLDGKTRPHSDERFDAMARFWPCRHLCADSDSHSQVSQLLCSSMFALCNRL
jgi:hypothetical protein